MQNVDLASLDISSLPYLPLDQRRELPNVSAIYFVLGNANEILYIGRAKSLCLRWDTHNRLQQFSALDKIRIAWLVLSDSSLLPQVENALISHFQPLYNGRSMPGGLRQTTLRLHYPLLRKARYFLDEDGKSINEFLVEQLEQYVARREQAQAPPPVSDCA